MHSAAAGRSMANLRLTGIGYSLLWPSPFPHTIHSQTQLQMISEKRRRRKKIKLYAFFVFFCNLLSCYQESEAVPILQMKSFVRDNRSIPLPSSTTNSKSICPNWQIYLSKLYIFVNISKCIVTNGSPICQYLNIARGTTDPGYWVYNLNHVFD